MSVHSGIANTVHRCSLCAQRDCTTVTQLRRLAKADRLAFRVASRPASSLSSAMRRASRCCVCIVCCARCPVRTSSATVRGLAPDVVRTAPLFEMVKLSPRCDLTVFRAGGDTGGSLAIPVAEPLLLLLFPLVVRNESVSAEAVTNCSRLFLTCTCLDIKPCSSTASTILFPVEDSLASDGRSIAAASPQPRGIAIVNERVSPQCTVHNG